MFREKSQRYDEMEKHYKGFISSMLSDQERVQKENVHLEEAFKSAHENAENLAVKNEELVDLVKQLDFKMSQLEHFIIKNVEDGERRLMRIIHDESDGQGNDPRDMHELLYTGISKGASSMNRSKTFK